MGGLVTARDCPEFDCFDCGRHIVLISGQMTTPPLCAACLFMPDWFKDPALREMLDPGHSGRNPADRDEMSRSRR